MACQAGMIPTVLGGDGRVLDLGRKRRLFSAAQSVALAVQDKTCTVQACDIPAAWCHAHHDLRWASGGETSLANGRLLCPRHHRMVHHPDYAVEPTQARRIRLVRHRQ